MHSAYKLTNSSEQVNLDIGVPHLQKLSADKHSQDFRLYCELTVEAQRLISLEDEKLSVTTETLLVEPHYFNISCTPLTQEFLKQEKRDKSESSQPSLEMKVKQEDSVPSPEPGPANAKPSIPPRRKSLDKKAARENTYSKLVEERRLKQEQAAARRHQELAAARRAQQPPEKARPPALPPPPSLSPLKMPVLPNTPIPVSELPPESVRTPPKQIPNVIPALSGLTPIPMKDLNSSPQKATATAALPQKAVVNPESISIQVPMQGADGSQIMQTINVPKSVLAGASERPVLLTVTPKNGVNKGQKQIVVLSKTANGIGASVRQAAAPAAAAAVTPQASPSKILLGQRPAGSGTAAAGSSSSVSPAGISSILAASKPVTDINTILAAAKPVPSTELKGFQSTMVNSSAVAVSNSGSVQAAARPGPSTSRPTTVTLLQNHGNARPVIQQGQVVQGAAGQQLQRVIAQVAATPAAGGGSQSVVVGQQQPRVIQQVNAAGQRVIHTIVQPGQVLPNGKQVVVRDGKPTLIDAPPAAIAAAQQAAAAQRPAAAAVALAGGGQMPAGKIVLTNKGQVIQGSQAQSLAGKIINTSQGQFIIGSNGQLISMQKLVQNHNASNQSNQSIRFVVSNARSSQGTTSVTTAAGAIGTTPPQRVAIAIPGSSGVAGNRVVTTQVANVAAAPGAAGSRTIQLGAATAVSPAAAGARPTVLAASPAVSGAPAATASPNFNQVILNALSNRGLLSQGQNGKFVYVGDKSPAATAAASPSSAAGLQRLVNPVTPTSAVSTPAIPLSSLNPSRGAVPSSLQLPTTPVSVAQASTSLQTPSPINPSPAADKSMVQVIVSAPNLDSFNASPSLLRMASSLMEDPSIAELINTPCETADQSSQLNGDINIYGVKTLAKATAVADYGGLKTVANSTAVNSTAATRSFYYRDPRLPDGWYAKVDTKPGQVTVNYFTYKGERLRSLTEVAHYLKNKLMIIPSCRGFAPPAPLAEIPRLDQLSPADQASLPAFALPLVNAANPVIRQVDPELVESSSSSSSTPLKRPAATPASIVGGQDDKKSKIVFF